jgi:hypothetical protein
MNRQAQIERFLLAAHRLASETLRVGPARIGRVRAELARWRLQSGATRSHGYRDERLHSSGADLGQRGRVGRADDEQGAVLCSVSSMSTLISQRERAELLGEARAS